MPDQITSARIVKFARDVLVAHLLGKPAPATTGCPMIPNHGIFVTIRTAGHLRGCIGTFRSDDSLAELLERIVIESAQDSRFVGMPLTARDVSAMQIEISLLSPLQMVKDSSEIEVGRHGIVIEHGNQRGCFLPDVATQHGWDATSFLRQCCVQKMELPPDAWRDPEARLSIFTAEKLED
jgi:AmmeMemoRadiSam system protein A